MQRSIDAVEQYRKRQTITVTIDDVPFVFRRKSVGDFMTSGRIPAPMLAYVIPVPGPDGKGTVRTPETPEEVIQQMDAMDGVMADASLEPKIVAPMRDDKNVKVYPDLAPGQIGTWEILDDDKATIIGRLRREAGLAEDQAKPFREVSQEH